METNPAAVYSAESEVAAIKAEYLQQQTPGPVVSSGSGPALSPVADELEFTFAPSEIRPFTKGGLEFLNSRLPNPIPPSESEVNNINSALSKVLKKYLPAVMQRIGPEWVLAGTLAFFVYPRSQKQQEAPGGDAHSRQKPKRKKQASKEPSGANK